ncbi:MAG: peptidase MA family metallohydrolase [Candidatus Zixiibacteriota bacterium]
MKVLVPAFLLLLLLVFGGESASGQYYYGRNKVQYSTFDWQVMNTEHFRIYFYKNETDVARIAARIAEEAYDTLAVKFAHEVLKKIPLIVYSGSSYFSQTNIIPNLIPESVGGFTEFMKGRVAVPFNGSFHDFHHVIWHELVHVFTISKLRGAMSRHSRIHFPYPPFWLMEGLAEYWSEGWDTDADMFIKDMVLNNRMIPVSHLYVVSGTYFAYKLGQSLCAFIDTAYGQDKLLQLFDNWHKGRNFDEVVRYTLGDDLNEVSRKWEYALKKSYYPEIENLDMPKMESRQLTKSGYAMKGVPIDWDDGQGNDEWIIFKANRHGYTGLYMKPRREGKEGLITLLKGERSSKYESLYLTVSGIDADDSGLIVFASKSNETDVIYVYDLNRKKIIHDFRFDDIAGIRSPRFSPDNRQIVFSGIRMDGFSNLYLLDIATGHLRALTDDMYDDVDPAFSFDGREIIFATDRCPAGNEGAYNIYKIALADGATTQLTFGRYRDRTPEPAADGVYFSSDREGTFNLYHVSNEGVLTRQSDYITGVFNPRLTTDGTQLIYTGYQDMTYQIYAMDVTGEPAPLEQAAPPTLAYWSPKFIDTSYYKTAVKYETDYSFDIAQSTIAYDPVYGSLGGLQAAMSDMLGNHSFYFLLANNADTKDDFFSSLNFGLTYLNREKRLNWGIGFYHLFDEYYNDFDQYYDERQAGMLNLVSYPVSKFQRLELNTFTRYYFKDRRYGQTDREEFLMTNYMRWVYDNSIWDISGPIEGRRYNMTFGITNSLSNTRIYNRVGLADVRHYFRLGQYSAFANRLFAYSSTGIEPQRIYLGGSWSFRGFDRRAFYNRNVLFASNELRFPLIDDLMIGFPIGGLGFRGIRGALFFDVGSAWDDDFDQFYGSFGAGFRVNIGYVVLLRFDFSRTTDFDTVSPTTDFDFFFGWNF